MKERIVYRNRIELKILSITIAIIWGILYAIVLIGDLCTHSPHFWHNQKCLLIMLLVFCTPLLIIGRFKIIFDYKNKLITHTPYFSRKMQYHFDDLCVSIARGKAANFFLDFICKESGKRVFRICDADFENQTRESADYLKELLQGDAKFVYDLERSIRQEGYHFAVYTYSLGGVIGSVCAREWMHWITVEHHADTKSFTLLVKRMKISKYTEPQVSIVEQLTADYDSLTQSVLQLAHLYLS